MSALMLNPPLLTAPLLTKHGFRHGFSTRQGGVSAAPFDSLNLAVAVGDEPDHVAENQRRFAASVGFAADALFTLSQVHGRAVRVLAANDTPERVRLEQGDALVAAAGLAVGVRTADCVPVLLVDPETRQVAAVHAGWRGLLAGVVPAALAAISAPASRLCAALFPHIRRCCFEVDAALALQLAAANPSGEQSVFAHVAAGSAPQDVAEQSQQDADSAERARQAPARLIAAADGSDRAPVGHVWQATLPLSAAAAATDPTKKALVALDVIVRAQLLASGVHAANIDDVPGCTMCDRERFFSYRRDGARSGRHLTVVLG